MAKYRVSGMMTISVFCTVNADPEEEALQKASELPSGSMCHDPFNDEYGEEGWICEGLDGLAIELKVDE